MYEYDICNRIFEPLWTKRFKILPPDAKKEVTCAILYDLREVRELEKDTYFYHPDHIGSANWITNSAGEPIQHLQYLPFGELRLDQRLISWHSRYSFSAKEKDEESGYSYFGARYYDSDLSIFISCDKALSDYPSLTPYHYCANNPMVLVDPDGNKVRPYDVYSRKMIKKYLKEVFGKHSKVFYFTSEGLQIRQNQYNKTTKSMNSDQQLLFSGLNDVIHREETAVVKVQESNTKFIFSKYIATAWDENGMPINPEEYRSTIICNDGKTANNPSPSLGYTPITINNDGSNSSPYTSDEGEGNGSASAVFFHEVLDEFLNVNIYKKKFQNKRDKVDYQNAVYRLLGRIQRNGLDHE